MNTPTSLSRRYSLFFTGWLLCSICFTGCGGGGFTVPDGQPVKADVISLDPQAWYIPCGQLVPEHPSTSGDGAWAIEIPNSGGSLQYVQTPFRASTRHNLLSITFRIDANGAAYNGRVHPDAWDPATIRLFIERRGDDLRKEFYRWWASGHAYVLGSKDNTVVTIEVPLSPDYWTSVYGHHDAAEFTATLNDIGYVGITFGGSNYFASGVNMQGSKATFTLIDFQIR